MWISHNERSLKIAFGDARGWELLHSDGTPVLDAGALPAGLSADADAWARDLAAATTGGRGSWEPCAYPECQDGPGCVEHVDQFGTALLSARAGRPVPKGGPLAPTGTGRTGRTPVRGPGCSYRAGVTPEDRKALEHFAASKAARARVRDYLRDRDGSVQPGSDLAADDRLWPHHPTSQVAWTAMIAASDHLDLVEAILGTAPDRTYVTAPFSVVRGALVGAAQAAWILAAPTPVHRQQRALSIAVEYLNQRIGYQMEQLALCNEEQKAASRTQIDELLRPMLAEALRRRIKGHGHNDTQIIATAAEQCFPENTANVVATVGLHWRRLGGDAHSLGWQFLLGNVSWSGGDPRQLRPVTVTGDVADVVDTAAWAFQFLNKSIDRHKALSAGPA